MELDLSPLPSVSPPPRSVKDVPVARVIEAVLQSDGSSDYSLRPVSAPHDLPRSGGIRLRVPLGQEPERVSPGGGAYRPGLKYPGELRSGSWCASWATRFAQRAFCRRERMPEGSPVAHCENSTRKPYSPRQAALLLMLCALGVGCSHFRKTKECRALSAAVNPKLERVASLHDKGATNPENWRQIQTQYEALATSLKAARASDPELDRLRSEYVNIATSSAQSAEALASALGQDGSQPIYSARLRLRTLASEQSRVSRRIAQYCRP